MPGAAGKGARKAGLWHQIGEAAGADVLLIGEGFATRASVHEAIGRPAVVAFDAGNLAAVARELRRLHPAALLVLIADNDHGTEATTGRNPGREAADKVARAVRGVAVWPELAELPEGGSDWNDAARQAGADLVRDRIEAAIRAAMAAAQATLKPKAPAKAPAGRTSPARTAGQPNAAPEPQRSPAGRDARADTDRPGALADALLIGMGLPTCARLHESTGRNPGREAADKVARAVRGAAVWSELAELPEGGSDWNDAARQAGADLVRDRIEAAIRAAMAAAQATLKPKAPAKAPAGRTSPARAAGQTSAAPKPQRPPAGRVARAGTDHPGTLADVGGGTWPGGAGAATKPRMHD